MPDIQLLADRLWRGEIDTTSHHPVTALASGGEEIADGILFFKGIASANTVDTGAGLVMLDTGSRADTRPLHEAVRRWRPDAPLTAAVFSHHHVDHIFGVTPFEREAAERLADLVRQKDGLDYHRALQLTLKGWLFIHIPFTYSLLLFIVVHVVLVLGFSGGHP